MKGERINPTRGAAWKKTIIGEVFKGLTPGEK